MRDLMKKMACLALAAALAAGLMPQAALAQDTPQVGPAQTLQISDGAQGGAATGVYIDVLSDFRLIEMTSPFVAEGTEDALAITAGRLFATLDGGSGVASATWKVLDAAGDTIGVFDAVSEQGGKWVLPLSAGAQQGSLDITAPCEYTCIFTATDRSNVTVSGTVAFQVLAEGQTSDYAPKTIYKDHEQTFDGVATFAEPSASGLIHDYVQHLTSTELAPGSPAYEKLAELAAAHAAEQEGAGAYTFIAVWSLAALFTHEITGDPSPYKGELSVVIPLPADGPAPGERVVVFGYGTDGDREPVVTTVQEADGARYVQISTSALGAFAVGSYEEDAASSVRIAATAEGPGFINYEGTYTWPRQGVKRYILTPADGCRIAAIELSAQGSPIEVPASALQTGIVDIDLEALDASVAEVALRAVFEQASPSPDDEAFRFTAEVVAGSGSIAVNGRPAAEGPFTFGAHDAIELELTPELPCRSVGEVRLIAEGAEPIVLAVASGWARIWGITANTRVEVEFSEELPAPDALHEVTVEVEGGHGSIDTPFEAGASLRAQRMVPDGERPTFSLFPQQGYSVYTVTDGTVELAGCLAESPSGLTLTLPPVHRDHTVKVTFRKIEDKPQVIPPERYVTIEVASEVEAGSATGPATVTPPDAIIPKGGGYAFSIIPPSADATLSRVLVKGASELDWRDITDQVAASWVEWPAQPAGTTATGYYELALAGVDEDTFARVIFRDWRSGDPVRPPTPTRSLTINVTGEGGTVSPNTVGKEPLRVPVGKAVVVTIIRADGAYVSGVVSSGKGQRAQAADEVRLSGNLRDATGTAGISQDDVLGGEGTFEIPDSSDDEEWTFDFSFGSGGEDPDDPNKPTDPDDPNKPDDPDDPNKPGKPDDPNKPGTPDDPDDPGTPGTPGGPGTTVTAHTVTPVAVPGSDGRAHGTISPAHPVAVPHGDSYRFTFTCGAGYRVGTITANGVQVAQGARTSYLLENVTADTELRVTFVPSTEEDAVRPIQRPIHRLQSLAQTGDHLPVLMLSFAALGCAALGTLVLVGRRRKEQEAED